MRTLHAIALLASALAVTSCGSSRPTVEIATLDRLTYAIPSGWQSHELSDRYTKRVEWTPPDNETAKESVVIMRSSPRPALVKAPNDIAVLLDRAQTKLPRAAFSKATRFVTEYGLVGFTVSGEFVPPGKTEPYQRIHAILIDAQRSTLVHVLYTARVADREAFDIVVGSIHEGA